MKKQFINIALSAATVFCMVMLTSCDKQPNNNNNGELENGDNEFFDGKTIKGEIVNGDYYDDVYGLSVVKFVANHRSGSDDYVLDAWERLNIGSGKYVNGELTLTLPETIAGSELDLFWDQWRDDMDLNEDVFSDTNVRVFRGPEMSGYVIIYNSFGVSEEGNGRSPMCFGKPNNNISPPFVHFLYVDRDVIIKTSPSFNREEYRTLDMSLKKGWNCVYCQYDAGIYEDFHDGDAFIHFTTTPPEGTVGTYKFYLGSDYDDYISEWGLDVGYFGG